MVKRKVSLVNWNRVGASAYFKFVGFEFFLWVGFFFFKPIMASWHPPEIRVMLRVFCINITTHSTSLRWFYLDSKYRYKTNHVFAELFNCSIETIRITNCPVLCSSFTLASISSYEEGSANWSNYSLIYSTKNPHIFSKVDGVILESSHCNSFWDNCLEKVQ